jgi:transposase-like protein
MCCGRSSAPLRVVVPATQPTRQTLRIRTQKIELNKNEIQLMSVDLNSKDTIKCPLCKHSTMVTRVSGRVRRQCTNFTCRKILD